jgi:hypothetical protein
MQAILYPPDGTPQAFSTIGLLLPDSVSGYAQPTPAVATILGCQAEQVDVLAVGLGYVVWTVFDFEEGPANLMAMKEVSRLTGIVFESEDEATELRGPVLVVQ